MSEADRQRVVEELQRRATLGLLSAAELEDRLHRAHTVITRAGLEGILLDLPSGPAPSSHRPWAPPGAGPEPEPAGAAPGELATATDSPPPPSRSRWRLVVGGAVAVAALVVLGSVAGELSGRTTESSPAADTTPMPATTVAPPPTAPPPTTAPPSTTTTTGRSGDPLVLEVGRQIQPGLYTADQAGRTCWWQRLRAAEGGGYDVVAEDLTARPLVEVLPTDARVRLRGCADLVPYVPPATPATTVGDGDWLVGQDVAPGHYRVTAPDPDAVLGCTWSRSRGLGYGEADVIDVRDAWGYDLREDVDLAAGERFSTRACGTWTLQ